MYGYVIIGNRELNLNNNNNNLNINSLNINNLHLQPNNNLIQENNNNNPNILNEEIRFENPANRQINNNQRALTRVGYTELRNILQIRINLSNENQGNSNSFVVSNSNEPMINDPLANNEQASRELSLNIGVNEEAASINNEINQNISASQINPINDSMTIVSFPNNNPESRESENEILGLMEQVNLQMNPRNSL